MSSFAAPSRVSIARWILVGGVALFICGYVYGHVSDFLQYEECEPSETTDDSKADAVKAQSNEPNITDDHVPNTNVQEDEKEEKKEDNIPKFPVQVFVRMRPLVGNELIENHKAVAYQVKKNKKKKTQSLVLQKVFGRNNERDKKFTGFKLLCLPDQNNEFVFNTCILPTCVPSIFNGERVCAFAYGHTGSGKTHTIFGYQQENIPGMYQLFARHLFNDPRLIDNQDIFVEIRFTELYQGKVRDLLSATKAECFVREDEKGQIHLRAQPVTCDDGKIRAYPITGIRVQTEEELFAIIKEGIASRNVGKSTLHDKSSRSHAFLEYELVSTALIEERKALIEKEAEILQLHQMVDTIHQLAYKDAKVVHKQLGEKRLKMVEGLGIMDIMRLKDEIKVMQKEAKAIKDKEERLCKDDKRLFVGGTMVFVDLAGNEYGRDVKSRDVQEERERNQINKSLLALKECVRALHNNKDYVGYRNSKLTMYLRRYLRGKGSKAIMISNIGPSQEYAKQTVNTLQYSQLVAKA
eukprot:528485_1